MHYIFAVKNSTEEWVKDRGGLRIIKRIKQ